jgi:CRISPR-associated protein Cmr2
MNNSEFWLKKINALLHDPPDKPLDIRGHEGQSDRWARVLGITLRQQDFRQADWIASAADRLNFPSYKSIGVADFRHQPYLTHPLAGVRLNLGKGRFLPAQIDNSKLQSAIEKSLQSISVEIKQDYKKLFLWLWRNWSATIQQTESNQLGALWDLLPADTRIPDHPIWAHQALTSAIAATDSNPAFLLFTIGPVQAFISAARRTQDLWAGSYLLSYLNWAAIEVIAEEIGPDAVIFPNLLGQPLCDRWLKNQGVLAESPRKEDLILPSLPNRFLAIVPAEQGADLAKQADKAMRSQWDKISEAVCLDLEKILGYSPVWKQTWQKQTGNLFETYWQVYPWRPIGKELIQHKEYQRFLDVHKPYLSERYSKIQKILEIYAKEEQAGGGQYAPNIGAIYSNLYFITEKALGSRKGLRNFPQVDETGEKSTLGGDRATLYDGIDNLISPEGDFDRVGRQIIIKFWNNLADKLNQVNRFEIQDTGQERLDAVELTKRCAWRSYFKQALEFSGSEKDLRFPSTSSVATASFKEKIVGVFLQHSQTTNKQQSLDDLRKALKNWLEAVRKTPLFRVNLIRFDIIPKLSDNVRDTANRFDKSLLNQFLSLEGRLLFEETYQPDDTKPFSKPDAIQIRLALMALKELIKIAKNYGIAKPRKYFAVLMMDGDNMGQWIAGDKMPKYQEVLHPETRKVLEQRDDWKEILKTPRLMSPAIHGFISKALGDFSLKLVRYIVEIRHPGKLVYAGGDDVLALLPLDSVLEVARELRAAFSGEIYTGEIGTDSECTQFDVQFGKQKSGYVWLEMIKGDRSSRQLLATMGHQATASTGIAIAYYKDPLDLTLQAVRDAEKTAKSQEGRNAFSLTFLKRSGEIMSAGAKWMYVDKPIDTVKIADDPIDTVRILLKFQEKFADDLISSKFPYILKAEAETLAYMISKDPPLDRNSLKCLYENSLKALYTAEIKRLLSRQQGGKHLSKEEKAQLDNNFKTLANELSMLIMQADLSQSEKFPIKNTPSKLKTLTDLLVFTRFLATGEGEE